MSDLWHFTLEDRDFFQNVTAGTQVIVEGSINYDTRHRLVTIERVTPQRIIINSTQYRRSDGRELAADSWNGRDHLFRPTPARLAQVEIERQELAELRERNQLIKKITDFRYRDASLDTLRAIATLLEVKDEGQ